jgi:hypothetical protein
MRASVPRPWCGTRSHGAARLGTSSAAEGRRPPGARIWGRRFEREAELCALAMKLEVEMPSTVAEEVLDVEEVVLL